MRLICAVLACSLALPASAVADKDKGGKGKGKGQDHGDGAGATVTVVFASREREIARTYFVERHGKGGCPPGLAKKNNGCLPPGQAKKRYAVGQPLSHGIRYEPVPHELELRLGPAPHGYAYVMLDGDLLKLAVGTALVVDAIQGLVN
jgi:hypothetical protein